MTSVSIVREKERGTMEVLLASPLKQGTMILQNNSLYGDILHRLYYHPSSELFYFRCTCQWQPDLLFLVAVLYISLTLTYGLTVSTLVDKQVNA